MSLTLGNLCAELGSEILDVLLAPRGLDVAVREVEINDLQDLPGVGIGPDDIVLGVGADIRSSTCQEVVRAAGESGATAFAFKQYAALDRSVMRTAEEAGIALVAVGSEVPWSELHDLIRTWLAAADADGLPRVPSGATGDLISLADATAVACGGPITIEDTRGRVLAFSKGGQEVDPHRATSILERQVPEWGMRLLRQQGHVDALLHTREVVTVELPGFQPRRAIGIQAGNSALGAIWLAGAPGSLSRRADDALREASRIAAVHLMRHRALEEVDRRVRVGMVRMLLRGEGHQPPMLARLGFPASSRLVVVAIAAGHTRPRAQDGSDNRLADLVVEHLHAYRWLAASAPLQGRTYVLVAQRDRTDRSSLRRTLDDCLTRLRHVLKSDISAGISNDITCEGSLATGRRRADQCLDLAAPRNRVVLFDEVHSRAVIDDVQRFLSAEHADFSPELQLLLDYDREHGTKHIQTLRAFLDAYGDVTRAAAILEIHVNTLRYRLRRINEIISTDLAKNSDARLALELQLRQLARQRNLR